MRLPSYRCPPRSSQRPYAGPDPVGDGRPALPQPEVVEHDRRDVAKRPLLALVGALGPAAAEEDRPQRIAPVQGAMAAAADVRGPSPVDALVSRRGGYHQVAGMGSGERSPEPIEPVRI